MDKLSAIKLENVTKIYKIYKKSNHRILDSLFGTKKYEEHCALKNLTFNINKGEAVGVLGKNGAGKSTLLKILTGVTSPTSGKVSIDGKVAAILELNSGFDEELTGRQNIYLKGTILGFTNNEVDEKIKEIINFADIGKYIDQPVRTYSSGMKSRLGFAIAVNTDPDVLIIDEALSVGDDIFRTKCLAKMTEFREAGKTIFFVSHSIFTVKSFCTKCIWIKDGELVEYGNTGKVISKYETYLKEEKAKAKVKRKVNSIDKNEVLEKKDYIEVQKFTFKNKEGAFNYGDNIVYSFDYEVKRKLNGLRWSFTIRDAEKREVYSSDKMNDRYNIRSEVGKHKLAIQLKDVRLLPGKYFLSGELREGSGLLYVGYSNKRAFEINVTDKYKGSGITFINHDVVSNI